ncbi:MAG: hypothetical protein IPK82_29340 [Polyangiaceae bacterium]|nr:hypothetical protein [Polyangiaceae bacterium]
MRVHPGPPETLNPRATPNAHRAGPTFFCGFNAIILNSTIYHLPSAICHLPSTIYHLPLGALMDISLASLINVYSLSTGRRLFALGQVMKVAKEQGYKDLAAHCDQALEHDHKTRALETAWAAPNLPAAGPGAVQRIDLALDRTLVAIRDSAQAHADGAEEDDQELPKKVAKLLTAIFPAGVQAVTKATFVEQLAAVEGILATLKNKEYAATIQDLGLGRLVKQLGKLSGQFREALEAPEPPKVSFGDVRAARAQGQENLLQAVAMILGKHPTPSSTDLTARGALLGPILKQNEAVRLYLRSRRAIQDVNPETGEVDPNAPVAEPAPTNGPQPA